MGNELTWMGVIPEDWKSCPLKYIFEIQKRIAGKEGYTVLSITQSGIKPKNMSAQGQYAQDYSNYQLVYPGDFAMNHMDLLTGWVDISRYEGVTSPDYRVFTVRDVAHYCPEYYKFIFQYCYSNKVFYGIGQGVSGFGRWRLPANMFLNFRLPVPPFSEQYVIASYLDGKVAYIDSIINEVKASIDEYKQWKASIIYEAVTKGLDPNAEMKDSGVEWIGEMPAHWSLIPFKYVLQERNERNTSVISKERLSLSIDLGVTLYADKTTNLDRFKEDFSQYKLAYAGDLVMNSMNMIVGASGVSSWFGCVSPAYYTFYDTIEDHVTAKFCEYIFRNKAMLRVLHSLGKGIYSIERGDDRINTCRLKVSKDDLKKILIPIPPIEEQRKIVGYLKAKCTMLDTLVNEKQALITDLESYKKSLIFEVVTGKKRVV